MSPYREQLTGDWQVRPAPLDSAGPNAGSLDWQSVPACAHLQPVLYPDRPYWGDHLRKINEQVWLYRRTLTIPADPPYKRARLHFEAVDYFAEVWIDDLLIGRHEGGFTPFTLDITHAVQPGNAHTLTVRVSSPWDPPNPKGAYPTDHVIRGLVKGLYEHGEGVIPPNVNPIGIWRPVTLMLDDGISIDHVRIRTEIDGTANLLLRLTNATPDSWWGNLRLNVVADNHDGPGVQASLPVSLSQGAHALNFKLTIPEPQLWWPWDHGDPNLYRLEARLEDDTNTRLGKYESIFGVRTVELARSPEQFRYYINGREVFLRGSSYMPGLYLSQCDREWLSRDVDYAREAHLNLLRVHVHISPPELYDICNRAGMLIWQDFELNWIQDPSIEFEARARVIQREMMDMLINHPSIMTWTCHNEPTMVLTRRHNLEQHPDPALYADALAFDSTRPVFICSGQIEADWQRAGDAHTYYGAMWTGQYTDIYKHSFRLNTEFGCETPGALETLKQYDEVWERLKHLEDQLETLWSYQAELIQFQTEHLRRLRATGCAGYVHFWLADLVPQIGCGVLDAARRQKGGYVALKQASQPLLVALEHDGSKPRALWVFNDTMTAYRDLTLRWEVHRADGWLLLEDEMQVDLMANASHHLAAVGWAVSPDDCAQIDLTLRDADGTVLTANHYHQPFKPTPRPKGYPWKFDPYLGTKVFDRPGAPSLADQSGNVLFKAVPLSLREKLAEWAMRQQLPLPVVSRVAKIIDKIAT